jgi:hypothetical protein
MPIYEVLIPIRDQVIWPEMCCLCCSPEIAKERSFMAQYKSGEYGVTRKKTTLTVPGAKLCPSCHKRTTFSKAEIILLAVGFLIGLAACIFLMYVSLALFCFAILGGIVIWVAIFLIGRIFIKNRVEGQPLIFDVLTEKKTIGRIRPVALKFKFRNKIFAYEFCEINGGKSRIR